MPIYEYRCLDCERTFEKLRPISQADEPIACVFCAGANTRRAQASRFMAISRSARGQSFPLAGMSSCQGSCASCSRPCT